MRKVVLYMLSFGFWMSLCLILPLGVLYSTNEALIALGFLMAFGALIFIFEEKE